MIDGVFIQPIRDSIQQAKAVGKEIEHILLSPATYWLLSQQYGMKDFDGIKLAGFPVYQGPSWGVGDYELVYRTKSEDECPI